MNVVAQAVGGLLSISGLVGFVFGAVCTIAYYWGVEHWRTHQHPERRPRQLRIRSLTLLWALIFITTGYIGFQQQRTATDVRELATNTADCSHQFNEALRARAAIGTENDRLSQIQRTALADWLRDILQPPPDILELRETDPNFGQNPVYVRWALDTTTKYYDIIADAQEQQDRNEVERAKHQYPEPSCGK